MQVYLEQLYKLQQTQNNQYISPNQHHSIPNNPPLSPQWSQRNGVNRLKNQVSRTNDNTQIWEQIISTVVEMAKHFSQKQKTTHYAIYFVHLLLKDPQISALVHSKGSSVHQKLEYKLDKYLLASTCLLLASKFFEQDDNLILIADIQEHMKPYRKLRYTEMTASEVNALTVLDWNLYRVIPLDYTQIFQQIGTIFDFDTVQKQGPNRDDARRRPERLARTANTNIEILIRNMSSKDKAAIQEKVNSYVYKLVDLQMKNCIQFQYYDASDISVATILCARSLSGILNGLHQSMKLLGQYHLEDWAATTIPHYLVDIKDGALIKTIGLIKDNDHLFASQEIRTFKETLTIFHEGAPAPSSPSPCSRGGYKTIISTPVQQRGLTLSGSKKNPLMFRKYQSPDSSSFEQDVKVMTKSDSSCDSEQEYRITQPIVGTKFSAIENTIRGKLAGSRISQNKFPKIDNDAIQTVSKSSGKYALQGFTSQYVPMIQRSGTGSVASKESLHAKRPQKPHQSVSKQFGRQDLSTSQKRSNSKSDLHAHPTGLSRKPSAIRSAEIKIEEIYMARQMPAKQSANHSRNGSAARLICQQPPVEYEPKQQQHFLKVRLDSSLDSREQLPLIKEKELEGNDIQPFQHEEEKDVQVQSVSDQDSADCEAEEENYINRFEHDSGHMSTLQSKLDAMRNYNRGSQAQRDVHVENEKLEKGDQIDHVEDDEMNQVDSQSQERSFDGSADNSVQRDSAYPGCHLESTANGGIQVFLNSHLNNKVTLQENQSPEMASFLDKIDTNDVKNYFYNTNAQRLDYLNSQDSHKKGVTNANTYKKSIAQGTKGRNLSAISNSLGFNKSTNSSDSKVPSHSMTKQDLEQIQSASNLASQKGGRYASNGKHRFQAKNQLPFNMLSASNLDKKKMGNEVPNDNKRSLLFKSNNHYYSPEAVYGTNQQLCDGQLARQYNVAHSGRRDSAQAIKNSKSTKGLNKEKSIDKISQWKPFGRMGNNEAVDETTPRLFQNTSEGLQTPPEVNETKASKTLNQKMKGAEENQEQKQPQSFAQTILNNNIDHSDVCAGVGLGLGYVNMKMKVNSTKLGPNQKDLNKACTKRLQNNNLEMSQQINCEQPAKPKKEHFVQIMRQFQISNKTSPNKSELETNAINTLQKKISEINKNDILRKQGSNAIKTINIGPSSYSVSNLDSIITPKPQTMLNIQNGLKDGSLVEQTRVNYHPRQKKSLFCQKHNVSDKKGPSVKVQGSSKKSFIERRQICLGDVGQPNELTDRMQIESTPQEQSKPYYLTSIQSTSQQAVIPKSQKHSVNNSPNQFPSVSKFGLQNSNSKQNIQPVVGSLQKKTANENMKHKNRRLVSPTAFINQSSQPSKLRSPAQNYNAMKGATEKNIQRQKSRKNSVSIGKSDYQKNNESSKRRLIQRLNTSDSIGASQSLDKRIRSTKKLTNNFTSSSNMRKVQINVIEMQADTGCSNNNVVIVEDIDELDETNEQFRPTNMNQQTKSKYRSSLKLDNQPSDEDIKAYYHVPATVHEPSNNKNTDDALFMKKRRSIKDRRSVRNANVKFPIHNLNANYE